MARFAQYYIKYHHEFAPYDWEKRQEHLGALFERDESITFGVGEPSEEQRAKGEQYAKTYNHRVYHLQNNPAIIVMQFANSIDIPVEKNFGPDVAKDEPSCFVIIDNRDNLRTVAIQKRKKAFGNPGQVARIMAEKIDELLYKDKCYKMEILPEFYPEDLFEAWEKLQRNVQAMRFGVPELTNDEIIQKVNELRDRTETILPLPERLGESQEKLGDNHKKLGETDVKLGENQEKLGVNAEKLGVKLTKNRKLILRKMYENPEVSSAELSQIVGISTTAIDKNIAVLRDKLIRRNGPDKGGKWEVVID